MNSNEWRLSFSVGEIGFVCLFLVSGCKEQYFKVREYAENFLRKLYKSWMHHSMMRDNQLFLLCLPRKEIKRQYRWGFHMQNNEVFKGRLN